MIYAVAVLVCSWWFWQMRCWWRRNRDQRIQVLEKLCDAGEERIRLLEERVTLLEQGVLLWKGEAGRYKAIAEHWRDSGGRPRWSELSGDERQRRIEDAIARLLPAKEGEA